MSTKQKIYPFLVLITACLNMGVAVSLYYNCNGIFFTPVSEYFGVGRGMYSVMGTCHGFMLSFGAAFWGRKLKTASLRKCLIIAQGGLAGIYFVMAHAPVIYVFWFAGIVIGFCEALCMLLATPAIIHRWFNKHVGMFVGIASCMSGVSGVIVNPIAGKVLATYGWQTTYTMYAILIAVLTLPFTILILKDHPEDIGLKPYGYSESAEDKALDEAKKRGLSLDEAKKTRSYYLILFMAILYNFGGKMLQLLPSYATELGYAVAVGAALSSFASIGILFGKLAVGSITDRNIYIGSFIAVMLPAIGLFMAYFMGPVSPGFLYFGSGLYGIQNCVQTVLVPMVVITIFGGRDHTRIQGSFSSISSFCAAWLNMIFGFISDMDGGFTFLLMGSGTMLTVGFILGIFAMNIGKKQGYASIE